jgi:hypothetical protein
MQETRRPFPPKPIENTIVTVLASIICGFVATFPALVARALLEARNPGRSMTCRGFGDSCTESRGTYRCTTATASTSSSHSGRTNRLTTTNVLVGGFWVFT